MSNTKKRTWTTYKKETKALIKEFKNKLLLNNWNINIIFLNDDEIGNQVGWTSAACIDINHRYLTAEIMFYKTHYNLYKMGDDYEFKKTIIHELCHILTEPLYLIARLSTPPNKEDDLETIREQSTEQLASIIYNNK